MGSLAAIGARSLIVLASGYLIVSASSVSAQNPVYPFDPYPAIPPNVSDVDGTDMRLYFRGRTAPTQTMQGDFQLVDRNNMHFATVRVSYGPLSSSWSVSLLWMHPAYSSPQLILRNLTFSPIFPSQGQPLVDETAEDIEIYVVRGVSFEVGVEASFEVWPGVYTTQTTTHQTSTYQDMGMDEYYVWRPGEPTYLPPILSNPPYK